MIITQEKKEVKSSKAFSGHAFNIGDVSFVMEILRNKLYTNPVKALIQEYIANAIDAHTDAGILEPIVVNSPSTMVKCFTVEDFGKSMTEEQIATIFTQYGISTKRQSNDSIGGFGIGSKSGWAYTDMFNVVTHTNENGVIIQRNYCAYIGEDNIGVIKQISEVISSGKTGTKISIPVKDNDINRFYKTISEVLPYLEVEVTSNVEYKKVEYKNTFTLKYTEEYTSDKGVVIGGIFYRVNLRDLDSNKYPKLRLYDNNRITPVISNGRIEIQPDRANVASSDNTAKVISEWFEVYLSEIEPSIRKTLSSIKTKKEAYCFFKYHKLNNLDSSLYVKIINEMFGEDVYEEINNVDRYVEQITSCKVTPEATFYLLSKHASIVKPNSIFFKPQTSGNRAYRSNKTKILEMFPWLYESYIVPRQEQVKLDMTFGVFSPVEYGYYTPSTQNKSNISEFKYYVTKSDQMYDLGDGLLVTYDQLKQLVNNTQISIAFFPKATMSNYLSVNKTIKPFVEKLKEVRKEVVKHHTYKDKVVCIKNGYRYGFDSLKIPECLMSHPDVIELKYLFSFYNHKSYGILKSINFLKNIKLTEIVLNIDIIDHLRIKYPLIFGINNNVHAKKYIDLINSVV